MSNYTPAASSIDFSTLTHEQICALLKDISKVAEQAYRRGYEQGSVSGAPYAVIGKGTAVYKWRYGLERGGTNYEIAQGPPHEPGYTTTSLDRLEMEYRYAEAPLVEALFDSLPTGYIDKYFVRF